MNSDGNKVYTTDIIANRVEFIDTKAESEALASSEAAAPASETSEALGVKETTDGFIEIPDDVELPFA